MLHLKALPVVTKLHTRIRSYESKRGEHTKTRILTYYCIIYDVCLFLGVKPCSLCREDESRAFIKKEKWREEASRQKSKLPDLFTNMDRPKWSKPTTKCVYLVSSDFVLAWKGFVRGMTSGKIEVGESITHINNSSLLCEHGGLLHIPQFNWENEPDVDVVMVKEDEWSVIKEMFVVDHEIRDWIYKTKKRGN